MVVTTTERNTGVVVAAVAGAATLAALVYWYRQRQAAKLEGGYTSASAASYLAQIERTLQQLEVTESQLRLMTQYFTREMQNGLIGEPSTMKMIPSFVTRPNGHERGAFYALDLGGTNFRVCKVELFGEGRMGEPSSQQFTISKQAMEGDADDLFDFIALAVKAFVEGPGAPPNPDAELQIGFTFSFPVNQLSVNSGTLMQWTKGFVTRNVEGHDVVTLLQNAFHRQGVRARVVALVNDTVGTMVARSYTDTKCELGVIMGTGCNACYLENVSDIPKFHGVPPHGHDGGMIINMEWGGFGDKHPEFLPRTPIDEKIDVASKNPGQQWFEKMVAGMYLGEMARLILQPHPAFAAVKELDTSLLSRAIGDHSHDLSTVGAMLAEQFQMYHSDLATRQLFRRVSVAIARRTARLSATAIGAVLHKTGRLQDVTVAIDGSVFEKVPGVKEQMEDWLRTLYPESSVRLVLQHDGSGLGAAVIAATVRY